MSEKPTYARPMEWLNYHHLLYFWVVAREGSVVRASRELRLAHPTISGQIKQLEESLGQRLFSRKGRRLVLTEEGRIAFRYADEIFSMGQGFLDAMKGRTGSQPLRLVVGIADVLPKSVVSRLLEPAFHLAQPVEVICREGGSVESFVGGLADLELDLVLADAPLAPGVPVRAFNHLLGQCGTTFFAARALGPRLRQGFPRSLHAAPFLMPGPRSVLRRSLDQWLRASELRPRVVAEIDDSALAKVLGAEGIGVFVGPSVIEENVCARFRVQAVGRVDSIRQQFFAISVERRLKHPATIAICNVAREEFFPGPPR